MSHSPRAWIFSDAPYAGGAERYVRYLLEGAGPQKLGLVAVARPSLEPWLTELESGGVIVDRIEAQPLVASWRAWWSWLRRRRPDVVHVNMPGPYDGLMATAPWLAKRAGVRRVIVTEHLPGVGRVGKRYWWKRAFLGGIDRAITVCESHRDLMVREFGYSEHRVIAIRNGIDDPRQPPSTSARWDFPEDLVRREQGPGLRFVQVGSLELRKGVDVLIEAVRLLELEGRRAQVWLVGDGPDREQFEAQVQALGFEGHVHFAGLRSDVPRIMAGADVVVLASHREGLPFVLLEAAAMGTAMVATRVDGVAEVVVDGETGLLVRPDDAPAFARSLARMMDDPSMRERCGINARIRFEREFGVERMLDRTLSLYGAL